MRFPTGVTVAVVVLSLVVLEAPGLLGPADAGRAGTAPRGVTLTATPTSGVAPLPVDFVLSIPPNTSLPAVSWAFGDGSFLNGTGGAVLTPVHDYETSGEFVARATATWPAGSVNASVPITVLPANLSVGIRADVTQGAAPLTVLFNGSATGGTGTFVAFTWSFGDGDSGLGQSIRYTFATVGHFPVALVVTDTRGDTGRSIQWVNVSAAPTTNNSNATPPGSGSSDPPGSSFRWLAGALSSERIPILVGVLAVLGVAALFGARYAVRRRTGLPAPGAVPSARPDAAEEARADAGPPETLSSPSAGPPMASGHVASSSALPSRLTQERQIANRLIRHLAELPRLAPGDTPGPPRTQAGLVAALGAGQSAVSRVLGQLERAGVVSVVTTHVAGSSRRVKVYRLTPRGERLGQALRESGRTP
jgi:hypothetical protein